MDILRNIIAVCTIIFGMIIFGGFIQARSIPAFIGSQCYIGAGTMAIVIGSWWPLVIGFIMAKMLDKYFEARSLNLLRKSADQGHAASQNDMGAYLANGHLMPKDVVKAAAWYQKAANQGYAIAQYNLGFCYENGQGVTQDDEQAAFWYSKAANQGHAWAQFNLGLHYAKREGGKHDNTLGYMWLFLAAKNGIENAEKDCGIVADRLSPDDLQEAQKMANEWIATNVIV